ncbi:MAG: YggS family pyridoxal phosphate-dependent enzyme [Chloroflexaceae bacterium]|nr:YggS family pyridoxal phosphate-dependent enzyme [Chloroflexaceae bacterium]
MAERVADVNERIAQAAYRAGRRPEEITLIAATKTQSIERIAEALAAGITHVGENRVQEAVGKRATLEAMTSARPTWHLIGHLQRNKVKPAIATFDVIHSLDSVRLAQQLNQSLSEQQEQPGRLPVLLQVNISGEASKHGLALPGGPANTIALERLLADSAQIAALPHLDLRGVMTIAPLMPDPQLAQPFFRQLSQVREILAQQLPQHSWQHLSMGMTNDFEAAIAEGATMIRVGRALFGERPT